MRGSSEKNGEEKETFRINMHDKKQPYGEEDLAKTYNRSIVGKELKSRISEP